MIDRGAADPSSSPAPLLPNLPVSPSQTAPREDQAMTTTIKASCPGCGEVELTPDDVSLMVCSTPSLSYYAFECPTCVTEVRKPADDHVVSLLVSGGVPAQVWDLPAEAVEAKDGPALTYDDLLDFALHLGTTDLLASLAASTARS